MYKGSLESPELKHLQISGDLIQLELSSAIDNQFYLYRCLHTDGPHSRAFLEPRRKDPTSIEMSTVVESSLSSRAVLWSGSLEGKDDFCSQKLRFMFFTD